MKREDSAFNSYVSIFWRSARDGDCKIYMTSGIQEWRRLVMSRLGLGRCPATTALAARRPLSTGMDKDGDVETYQYSEHPCTERRHTDRTEPFQLQRRLSI